MLRKICLDLRNPISRKNCLDLRNSIAGEDLSGFKES